jgi:hypothetical protein
MWLKLNTKGEVRIRAIKFPILGSQVRLEPPKIVAVCLEPKRRWVLEASQYFGGATIRGALILSTREKLKYQNIKISFIGEQFFHWVTEGENGDTDHYLRSFIVRESAYIAGTESSIKVPASSKFEPGLHVVPFSIQLPTDLPAPGPGFNNMSYRLEANFAKSMAKDTKEKLEPIHIRGPHPASLPSTITPFTFDNGKGIRVTILAPPVALIDARWTFEMEIQNNSECCVGGLQIEGFWKSFWTQEPNFFNTKYNYGTDGGNTWHWNEEAFYINGSNELSSFPVVDIGSSWRGTVGIHFTTDWCITTDRRFSNMCCFKNFLSIQLFASTDGTPQMTNAAELFKAEASIWIADNPARHVECSHKQHGQQGLKIQGATLQDPTPAIIPPAHNVATWNGGVCVNMPLENAHLTEALYSSSWDAQVCTKPSGKGDLLPSKFWTFGNIPTTPYKPKKNLPGWLDAVAGLWYLPALQPEAKKKK